MTPCLNKLWTGQIQMNGVINSGNNDYFFINTLWLNKHFNQSINQRKRKIVMMSHDCNMNGSKYKYHTIVNMMVRGGVALRMARGGREARGEPGVRYLRMTNCKKCSMELEWSKVECGEERNWELSWVEWSKIEVELEWSKCFELPNVERLRSQQSLSTHLCGSNWDPFYYTLLAL